MIQFIPQGPQIPEEIMQALNNDNLVLFCGAGISMNNGLPSFEDLVKEVCEKLHININEQPLLREAKERGNYDSILDLIEEKKVLPVSKQQQENLVTTQKLRKEIIKILNNYTKKSDIHKSLLDLSALPENKGHRLVTTNFDKLFFIETKLDPALVDSAPKLAPPRKETWNHLTFLHGVIDEKNDPEGRHLILTKKDFGLAYLYYNWASHFITQLFQNFTVLFIGYSVNDPVMNYLVSAMSYENYRKKQDKEGKKLQNSIYAFVGYEKNTLEKKQNEWKSFGIQPIPYKMKTKQDHSLLNNTIKEWANLKKKGLAGKKSWLKKRLEIHYTDSDKKTVESTISFLKIDERLAEYFSQINISSDIEKKEPVDISWLKPLSEAGLLKKLTKTHNTSSIWEPLSHTEKQIALWLLFHLNKKELIHWLIDQVPRNFNMGSLIYLHPEFKNMLKFRLKNIEKEVNTKLNKRKRLFWEILSMQKEYYPEPCNEYFLINKLNKKYCPTTANELLSYLEPQIGFEKCPYDEIFPWNIDKIYEPKLRTHMNRYPDQPLEDETTLLVHAEDFSNLLKKAMELMEFANINQKERNFFSIEHKFYSWIYLIDLVRNSFDLAMKKNKPLASFLLHKWKLYSYSLFYQLIFYAVTKHTRLNEKIAVDLLLKEENNLLWEKFCDKEILQFFKKKNHSKTTVKKLLPLIIKGPPKLKYLSKKEKKLAQHIKERKIYWRLNCLKLSGVQLPKNIEKYHNEIQSKHSLPPSMDISEMGTWTYAPENRNKYHHLTNEQIFQDIKCIKSHPFPDADDNAKSFRSFTKDFPERAFKVLCMFEEDDINIAPYFSAFIRGATSINDTEKSNNCFLKSLQKIEKFDDEHIKKCLWPLVDSLSLHLKANFLYLQNKGYFKKWWNRLWNLSVTENELLENNSNFEDGAFNSKLGRLSQPIFSILWDRYTDTIPKGEKVPGDINKYFQTIIQGGIKKEPSVFYHFGFNLYALWRLDREWTVKNIKPLINWEHSLNTCKALWEGYLYHIRPNLDLDFLFDFKNEFYQLFLNYKKGPEPSEVIGYFESISRILFITTGGRKIKNIFTNKETKKLIQNMNKDILEPISRQVWYLLKDSGDKSANLWSEEINPWIEKFWPPQIRNRSHEIAQNLSFVVLYCREKLPETCKVLEDKIKEVIQHNNYDMLYHIKENVKQELSYIFNYPQELLYILNWNFPEDKIDYYYSEQMKEILNELKNKHPEIEKDEKYIKLIDKLS